MLTERERGRQARAGATVRRAQAPLPGAHGGHYWESADHRHLARAGAAAA